MFAAVSSTSRHLRGIAQTVILPALVLTYAVNTFVRSARWSALGQQHVVAPEKSYFSRQFARRTGESANLPAFTPAKRTGSTPFPKTDIRSGCWSWIVPPGAPARAPAIPRRDRPA